MVTYNVYEVSQLIGKCAVQMGFCHAWHFDRRGYLEIVDPFTSRTYAVALGLVRCRGPWRKERRLHPLRHILMPVPYQSWMSVDHRDLEAAINLCEECAPKLPPGEIRWS